MGNLSAKKLDPRCLLAGCVFLLSMFYFYLQTHHGVDLTDVGYHLTMQKIAFHEHTLSNYYFLSNWLGGAWLALHSQSGSFHWALLGGALIWSLIISVFTLICYELINCKASHLLLVVAGGMLSLPLSQLLLLIDYFTVPVLLSGIYLLLLVLFLKHRHWQWVWFLLGILHALLIFSRVITALYCVLPLLAFIADWKYKYLGLNRKMFLLGLAGFAVTLIPGLLWLTPAAAWDTSGAAFDAGFGMTLFYNLRSYIYTFKFIFTFFSCVLVLMLILSEARLPAKLQLLMVAGLQLLALAFWLYNFRQPYTVQWNKYFNFTNTAYASLGVFLLCLSLGNRHWKLFSPRERLKVPLAQFNILLLIALCMAYLMTYASATDFFRSLYFGPLFFSLTMLLLLDNKSQNPSAKILPLGLLLVFTVSGVCITYGFTFRDLPRSKLTTVIPDGRLKGMRVSAAQAERLQHAEKVIGPMLDTSKPIFAEVHNEFLLHYLFGSRPFYTGWIKPERFRRQINKRMPETIVISSHDFDQGLLPYGECKICPFLEQEIMPEHYQLTHKDQFFKIYQKIK